MKCADKVAYKTRGEAYDFAKNIRKRNGKPYIYECQFCGKFHITHIKPWRWHFDRRNAKHYDFKKLTR